MACDISFSPLNHILFDVFSDNSDMALHYKYQGFDVFSAVYSVVDEHPISTDIIIPKSLPEGHHCPVIVRFHGGFLVRATSFIPFNTHIHPKHYSDTHALYS